MPAGSFGAQTGILKTEDGVLHFMVTYEASVTTASGIPMMETLAIDQGTTER